MTKIVVRIDRLVLRGIPSEQAAAVAAALCETLSRELKAAATSETAAPSALQLLRSLGQRDCLAVPTLRAASSARALGFAAGRSLSWSLTQ